jgi:hypothetical protein
MLTGKKLFDGETVSHTLADVLRAPIDFEQVPRGTPMAVHTLLQRCLDRDVKRRLRDIGEARVQIENYFTNPRNAWEPSDCVFTVAARHRSLGGCGRGHPCPRELLQ